MHINCSEHDLTCNLTDAVHLEQLMKLFMLYNQHASAESNQSFESLLEQANSLLETKFEEVNIWPGPTNNRSAPVHSPVSLGCQIGIAVIHLGIFLFGCVGNVSLIAAAYRSKFLRTPTYCYLVCINFITGYVWCALWILSTVVAGCVFVNQSLLQTDVSLATADLLVLCTAIPQEVLSIFGQNWMLGYGGCGVMVFLNFFGINVGSMSILAFTAERYVAICQPLYAYRICTVARTRNIIRLLWVVVLLYSAGWLLSTNLLSVLSSNDPHVQQCNLVMPAGAYTTFFAVDLVIFYVFPLGVCVLAYTKIFFAIKTTRFQPYCSIRVQFGSVSPSNESKEEHSCREQSRASVRTIMPNIRVTRVEPQRRVTRTSMLRLLVVVVVFFGVAWLPFRLIPIYKSFYSASTSSDNLYLFCAQTLVYLNCASNPLLYNVMSPRFRAAMRHCGFRCLCRICLDHSGGL